jgi:hypothetical protein
MNDSEDLNYQSKNSFILIFVDVPEGWIEFFISLYYH